MCLFGERQREIDIKWICYGKIPGMRNVYFEGEERVGDRRESMCMYTCVCVFMCLECIRGLFRVFV